MSTSLQLIRGYPTHLAKRQAIITEEDGDEAWAQLQEPLSTHSPGIVPPLLAPLVIASPFGSGKRAVLQQLLRLLPVLAVPRILTTRPRADGSTGAAAKGMQYKHIVAVGMCSQCLCLM